MTELGAGPMDLDIMEELLNAAEDEAMPSVEDLDSLIYRDQERFEEAEAQFARMVAINAENYPALVELGRLRHRRGDTAGAISALEAAIYIYPYDFGLHRRLAEFYTEFENWPQVIRARQSLLALKPVDLAEAHYQLAIAFERAGNRSSAREQILYSLEIAPNYVHAQDLLLSLWQQQPATAEP